MTTTWLWFDVGIVRYTTPSVFEASPKGLWFDVGIVRYTTCFHATVLMLGLWFDVGIVRYTTCIAIMQGCMGCGLM